MNTKYRWCRPISVYIIPQRYLVYCIISGTFVLALITSAVILGRLSDAAKELHPQTDRERQLELQMAFLVQQLHSEEKAKQKLSELKQLCRKEQDTVDECQKACERYFGRELDKDVLAGRETDMKYQKDVWTKIRLLKADSERGINKYRKALNTAIKRMLLKLLVPRQRLEDALREARYREKKLHGELKMSEDRSKKWERELRESKEIVSTCSYEVQQSEARQNQFQHLINDRGRKLEQARKAGKDISAIAEKIHQLQQEIAQTDMGQSWRGERKSTNGEEVCQQTSAEGNILSHGLQSENKQRLKQTLEMIAERLKNKLEKIDRVWKGSEQTDQTRWIMENEEKLQKRLKEASARDERIQLETKRALSEEKEMQQLLRQACSDEEYLISQLIRLRDSVHCKCSVSYQGVYNSWKSTVI